MPASIWGNELSLRFGRHRAITAVQMVAEVASGGTDRGTISALCTNDTPSNMPPVTSDTPASAYTSSKLPYSQWRRYNPT